MAPLSRIVTGTWYTADALPDGGAEITYTLDPSSYTGDALISGGTIPDVANELGESATALWTNEDGYDPTRYIVTWPSGRQDTFTLPAGADPIALNTLLQTAEIVTWPPSVIVDYLEAFRDEIYSSFASTEDELGDALVGYRAPHTGAIGRTVHERLADEAVNIRDFGAIADDTMVYDGAAISGSTTITSLSSTFTDADIGKAFTLVGAGASGATLNGTFTARLSATEMTSSVAAQTTVSGQALGYGTENAPAWTLAIAAAGPDGVLFIPPGKYYMNVSVTIPPIRAIMGYGATIRRGLLGNMRVNASNVSVYGVTFTYDTTKDNTRRSMFDQKDSTLGDIPGNHTGWRFIDCVWDGILLSVSRMNRVGNATFAISTTLATAAAVGATTLNVTSGATLATAHYVRIGPVVDTASPSYGLYMYPGVVSVVGNVVTIDTPLLGAMAIGQFVSLVTHVTGTPVAGTAVLSLTDLTGFAIGSYAELFFSAQSVFLSLVTALGSGTITIDPPLPQSAPANCPIAPMNNAVIVRGTDHAGGILIQNCEVKNVRNSSGIQLSGVDDVTVQGGHIHDIFTYLVAGDPESGINSSLGEGMKITVGSTRIKILGNTIERYTRDGLDCYDAGEVQIVGNSFKTSYVGNAIEAKWLATNINPARPITFMGNRVQDMFSNGLQIGGQNFIVSGNLIERCRSMGIYCNGGRPDDADTLASRDYTVTGNMLIHNGWKEAVTIVVRGTGGTWTISANDLTTEPMPYGAPAWAVQLALVALGGLAARAGVTRSGSGPYTYTIDPPGLVTLPPFTASGAGLTGRQRDVSVAFGEVSNSGSGIYVAEVKNAVITGNRSGDSAVSGLYLTNYATNAVVGGNNFLGNAGADLTVYGDPSVVTGHIIAANQYATSFVETETTGIVWDGMGTQTGLAAATAPSLTLWPRLGTLVKNATDGTLWQRDVSAFIPLGLSTETLLLAPLVWNGMDGNSGKILTVAASPHLVNVTALGVPAAAKSVIVEVAGRWAAASHSSSCTVSNGTGGGRAGLFRSVAANIGGSLQVKALLQSGQFRIAIANADMDTALVSIKGWVI